MLHTTDLARAGQPERNAHVHPLFRGFLNSFSATVPSEHAIELQAERLAEWRADDREMLRAEHEGWAQ